ncbi:hypothetical protein C2845_PM11G09540 [Panicum miliaceum]|uniref:Uncharacterized protein n=1 Tax=Panicum miliaceum TaxID=4540 RepID=A0A3L6RY45_PANMI|nr:hypothetical protein C2845_PM11G09540 [Panicum miliaceum]
MAASKAHVLLLVALLAAAAMLATAADQRTHDSKEEMANGAAGVEHWHGGGHGHGGSGPAGAGVQQQQRREKGVDKEHSNLLECPCNGAYSGQKSCRGEPATSASSRAPRRRLLPTTSL